MIIIHYKHKYLFSLAIFFLSFCPERCNASYLTCVQEPGLSWEFVKQSLDFIQKVEQVFIRTIGFVCCYFLDWQFN